MIHEKYVLQLAPAAEILRSHSGRNLLVILLLLVAITLLGSLGLLSANATGATAAKRRGQSEVNVLLGVETDDERGHVDNLLADTDVALTDKDTGVVNRLGEAKLVDAGLEATLQEILKLQGQHVIELHAGLVENTDTDKSSNQGIAFEETLGVLLVECKKLTGSTTDLGQSQTDSPDLTLVAQAILSDELQLRVKTGGLEGAARDTRGLRIRARRHARWPLAWCCTAL
jgi:hypothetical protein